jgi:hypothetical protein
MDESLTSFHSWGRSSAEIFQRIQNHEPLYETPLAHTVLKIAPNPFTDEGAMRWPYYAAPVVGDGLVDVGGDVVVVKRFKQPFGASPAVTHSKERYMQQMEIQTVSAQLASEFSERLTSQLRFSRTVAFATVTVLEVIEAGKR